MIYRSYIKVLCFDIGTAICTAMLCQYIVSNQEQKLNVFQKELLKAWELGTFRAQLFYMYIFVKLSNKCCIILMEFE